MTLITRRAALRGIASIPAIGGATAALALPSAQEPELAVTRVKRLADELSYAMDAWMDEISEPMRRAGNPHRAHWIAHVHPQSHADYPIAFENVRARHVETPEQRVHRLQEELVEARKVLHPEITYWRIIRPDDFEDDSNMVGFFMMVGHPEKAVRS